MKFTIIMPTYNDSSTIIESINSILEQTYQNWELLISDDGSTDDTKKVVQELVKNNKECRITYFYHENKDQLNAIMQVMPAMTGDIIYILHSDDIFDDVDVLEKANDYFENNKIDAIIADSEIINENSKKIGDFHVKKYKKCDSMIALQLLWLGRNLFTDMAFHTKDSFMSNVKENYLCWNTPFWLDLQDKPRMLDVKNVDFNFFKYRVFQENYINNEIGKFNVLNGELRTAVNLMKYYDIPFYKFQYYIFRTLNKLNLKYYPFYLKRETKNKYDIIKFIVKKRCKDFENNIFLKALLNFYLNNKDDRKITINNIDENEQVYTGADMRIFNKKIINNELSDFYKKILDEMNKGFKTIITNKKNYNKVVLISKFLCIYPFIDIEIK